MSFIAELKRRNVVRTAVAYLVLLLADALGDSEAALEQFEFGN